MKVKTPHFTSDEELIRNVRSSVSVERNTALKALYYRIEEITIREKARTWKGKEFDADIGDVIQQTMLSLVNYIDSSNKIENLGGLITKIARNRWSDLNRKCMTRKRHEEAFGQKIERDKEVVPAAMELKEKIMDAMESLRPECEEIIRLYYFEGWQVKPLADKLGWQESNMKKKLSMCRVELKELLCKLNIL